MSGTQPFEEDVNVNRNTLIRRLGKLKVTNFFSTGLNNDVSLTERKVTSGRYQNFAVMYPGITKSECHSVSQP